MNLKIGSRLNVPHFDKWQGVVVVRSETQAIATTPVKPHNIVTLRYLTEVGDIVDATFPVEEVLFANPTPVDVAALTLERDHYATRVADLQTKLAQRASRAAARKSKSKKRR